MKLKNLKIIMLSSIIALNVPNTIQACGPQLYTDQSRFSVFGKDMVVNPSFAPFQYTHDVYDSYDNDIIIQAERTQNINEWKAIAANATESDINAVQYYMSNAEFLNNINQKNISNTFIKWLLQPTQKPYLDYMKYAKKMEQLQGDIFEGEDWQELFQSKKIDEIYQLGLKMIPLITSNSSVFLKERYTFQTIKSFYYRNLYGKKKTNNQSAIKLYNNHLANSKSVVAQWAILYFSGLQENPYERAKQLLLAFDASKEKRFRAFKLIDNEALDLIQQYPMDTKLQEIFMAIKAIKNPGRALEDIQNIYALNANSKYLPLLINREVNKLEDWIWSPKVLKFHSVLKENLFFKNKDYSNYGEEGTADTSYDYFAVNNLKQDIAYAKDVVQFISQMNFKNSDEQTFAQLASAHIFNIVEEPHKALEILNKNKVDKESIFARQHLTDVIIATINAKDITKNDVKSELASYLKTYREIYSPAKTNKEEGEEEEFHFSKTYYQQLLAYLGRAYLSKNQSFIGAALLSNADVTTNEYHYPIYEKEINYGGLGYWDQYAKPEDIAQLIAFQKRTDLNEFEQLLKLNPSISENMLLDLQGTLLSRQGKYDEALTVFNKLNNNFWKDNYEYATYLPQHSVTYLGNILPVSTNSLLKYNQIGKKEITQEIVNLKKAIASEQDKETKAKLLFQLANASYNISYYGKAWMYSAYGKSENELYTLGSKSNWTSYSINNSGSNHIENYYGLEETISLYQQALQQTNNPEMKAQITTMLAHCDQLHNDYIVRKNSPDIYVNGENNFKSKYWGELGSLNNTAFYKVAITSCPDVRNKMK